MEEMVCKSNIRYIRGLCGEYINGKLYFYALDFNGILEYDLQKNEKKILLGRNTVKDDSFALSTTSILYKDSIYFIHRYADSILKFSVKKHDKKEIFAQGKGNAFDPVVIEDKLLLMPQFYAKKIPYINLQTDEIYYMPFSMPEHIRTLIDDDKQPILYGDICVDNYIYRVFRLAPYISRFNVKTNVSEYIKVRGTDEKFYEITYDGYFFWIAFIRSSRIIKWEAINNKIIKCIDLQAYMSEQIEVISVKYARGKLYIFIKDSAKIIEWDDSSDNIHIYDPTEFQDFQGSGAQFFSQNICQDETGVLYFLPRNANGILAIDDRGCMKLYKTDVAVKDILDVCSGQHFNEGMCSVESFLDVIEEKKNKSFDKERVGEQIWKCFQQER